MMRINTENIKSFSPCESGLKPWLQHYSESDLSLKEFLSLEHIEAKDKVWLAVRILPRQQIVKFTNNCAFRARKYATTATSAYAYAYAAAHAHAHAYAAAAHAAAAYATDAERVLQVEDLIILCSEVGESI